MLFFILINQLVKYRLSQNNDRKHLFLNFMIISVHLNLSKILHNQIVFLNALKMIYDTRNKKRKENLENLLSLFPHD